MDYRIIAPSEAPAALGNPDHEPTEPLGSLAEVRDWLAHRVASFTPDADGICYRIATGNGGGPVHLWTSEAYRQWRDKYIPRDDYAVTTISFMMYGDFDPTLIGDCAARFHGTIFDHQSSEMLSPEEFLGRIRCRGR
ncbi:MAG TPA: hypothetical protein VH370_23760 [Humisphaera sp.]|nr:hypothetical protein [Humisphaera sp.]